MRQPTVLQFNKIRTTKCSSFFLGDKFMKQQCVSPRNVSIRRSAQNISLWIGCVLVSSVPPEVPDGGLPQHICQSAHGGFRFLIHNVRTDAVLCQCYFQSFLRRNGGGRANSSSPWLVAADTAVCGLNQYFAAAISYREPSSRKTDHCHSRPPSHPCFRMLHPCLWFCMWSAGVF